MNWLKHSLIQLLILCCSSSLVAQELLTTDQAVSITLDNNYGIKVARNNVRVADNNTSKSANGYLPSLNISSGTSVDLDGSRQEFADGTENTVSNVFSWGGNASLGLNYALFDQVRGAQTGRLREVLDLSNLDLRRTIELNLLQLFRSYYDVAQFTASTGVLQQTLEVSKRRLQRVQYQYDFGQGTRLDLLNAQVDVQRDSISVLNIQTNLANARRNLQVIMGTTRSEGFVVDTTVVYEALSLLPDLMREAKNKNIDVLIAQKNLEINAFDLKIINAGRMPTVDASASYDHRLSRIPDGASIVGTRNGGLGAGLSLNWSIFDGGLRGVRRQNTEIANENQRILLEQLDQEIERDVSNVWSSYQNALFVLDAEQNNLATNQLNFERTEEQFNLGQLTSLEFRQAQTNLLNAALSFYTAKYDAKVLELELQQLTGRLLDLELVP